MSKYRVKRRHEAQIIHEMLGALREGPLPQTKIQMHANIQYTKFVHLIDRLMLQGLIEIEESRGRGSGKWKMKVMMLTNEGRERLKFIDQNIDAFLVRA